MIFFTSQRSQPFRDDVALALLDAFPFPPAYALADLLDHALAATARRGDLLRIVLCIVAGPPGDKPGHWDRLASYRLLALPD